MIQEIVKELVKRHIHVELLYDSPSDTVAYVVHGFYKSGTVTLIEQNGVIVARSRYDGNTEITELRDLAYLNLDWWRRSENRYDGWANPDGAWVGLLEEFNLVTKQTETVTTWVVSN
jgi:hypothetical protein